MERCGLYYRQKHFLENTASGLQLEKPLCEGLAHTQNVFTLKHRVEIGACNSVHTDS